MWDTPYLIDSHCHLDALEFANQQQTIVTEAQQAGVGMIVVPAVEVGNFDHVIALSTQFHNCVYALGIHPMYVAKAGNEDVNTLRSYLHTTIQSAHPPVAVGEIGLDFFAERGEVGYDRQAQIQFFCAQLQLAQEFNLPVILHVRRSVDEILKYLRKIPVKGGIAHAFNGSLQQAHQLIALGFKLGFGGAMTYTRALHIRQLAKELPIESIVLETDAPDIPPVWIKNVKCNSPKELINIAKILSEIRQMELRQVIESTTENTLSALCLREKFSAVMHTS